VAVVRNDIIIDLQELCCLAGPIIKFEI
jgi:hypothetical protein